MEKSNDTIDPRALIERAKNGDSGAFDELYSRFLTPIYRYVYFRVKRKEDAEDIAQTVFLRAYQSLPRFEDKGVSPLAYFYSIARNAVIDHWRKKGEIFLEDMDASVRDIPVGKGIEHSILERVWSQEIIAEGMSSLTHWEAEVVTLKFLHDVSNAEIARALGKSEEAVRQLQSRGLRKMRGRLQSGE